MVNLVFSSLYFSILWVRESMMRILEKLLNSLMNWNLLKPASWALDQVGVWHIWMWETIEILLDVLTPSRFFFFFLPPCVVYHPQIGYSHRSRCSSTSSSVTGSAPVEAPAQVQPQASGYTSRPNVPHKQVMCTQTQTSLPSLPWQIWHACTLLHKESPRAQNWPCFLGGRRITLSSVNQSKISQSWVCELCIAPSSECLQLPFDIAWACHGGVGGG